MNENAGMMCPIAYDGEQQLSGQVRLGRSHSALQYQIPGAAMDDRQRLPALVQGPALWGSKAQKAIPRHPRRAPVWGPWSRTTSATYSYRTNVSALGQFLTNTCAFSYLYYS